MHHAKKKKKKVIFSEILTLQACLYFLAMSKLQISSLL